MARKRTVGLIAFLKGSSNPKDRMPGCANYDHHYGGCLLAKRCLVQDGKRCRYFEEAVLPTAADTGRKELVYALYEKQVGIGGELTQDIKPVRECPDCGGELKPRQRYCDDCGMKRRRQAYRKARRRNG